MLLNGLLLEAGGSDLPLALEANVRREAARLRKAIEAGETRAWGRAFPSAQPCAQLPVRRPVRAPHNAPGARLTLGWAGCLHASFRVVVLVAV